MIRQMEHPALERHLDQADANYKTHLKAPEEKLTRTEELMREHGYLMHERRAIHNHIDKQDFAVVPASEWRDELNRINVRLHQIQIELDQERLREEMKVAFATIDLHHDGISKCYERIGAIEAELTERDEALANSKAIEARKWGSEVSQ